MNLRNILLVYAKELKDAVRDRRTLISMVVVPVLVMPLLIFGLGGVTTKMVTKAGQESARVALLGVENAPALAERLRAVERFRIVEDPDDPKAEIAERRLRVAVEFPEGFQAALERGEAAEVLVYHYDGDIKSESALRDVRRTASAYRNELVSARLEHHGLDESLLVPFSISETNVASKEQVGGRTLGGIVPYIIILMCMTGAMYPAIDLTAGEKERGTIETILVSSVSRLDLVLGKFLTVLTASVSTAVLSLTSLAITGIVIFPRLAGGDAATRKLSDLVQVDPLGLVGMVVLLIPLTVLFSSALLAIALFAKSYKEAQSYISPLMIVVIVPAVMGMLPGFELTRKMALIPVVGTSLASKELLAGSFPWGLLATIFISTSVYALLALFWAVRQFQREDVLFRS